MDDLNTKDYSKLKVSDLLKKEKDQVVYEYDFGDSWEHNIILEKILEEDSRKYTPICLTGRNNCPPEDCGGVWGYYSLLETLQDPGHEEYENYLEWLGDDFDPKYFNKKEINEALQTTNFGCLDYF
jgi:hypothetical protein